LQGAGKDASECYQESHPVHPENANVRRLYVVPLFVPHANPFSLEITLFKTNSALIIQHTFTSTFIKTLKFFKNVL
jgi:hypothetical protein